MAVENAGAIVVGRPKRLIVVAIMNIAVALISVAALAFVLTSSRVPGALIPRPWSAAFSMLVAIAVIVSSVLALIGLPKARWVALILALAFFGILWLQGLLAAVDPVSVMGEMPNESVVHKLWAGVVRNSIEIGLNLWAFLSVRTSAFFEGRRAEA